MKANLAWLCAAVVLSAGSASAQSEIAEIGELAETIVAMTSPVWKGPRVSAPTPADRPAEASIAVVSARAPFAVHAQTGVTLETAEAAGRALELAMGQFAEMGWPGPISDGGLGEGAGFDLYLAREPAMTEAYSDDLVPWSYLDRASTFAVVDPLVPAEALDACVTNAYAEAVLLAMDPAEARTWRKATAAWLTWELVGQFGCQSLLDVQQSEPHRSWIAGAAGSGAAGAPLLAYLAARHGDGSGKFVREVWELASQRTWEGEALRAEPDLWAAFQTAIELSGDTVHENIEDLAVARYLAGNGGHPGVLGAAFGKDARVSLSGRIGHLPSRVTQTKPLQPYGSGYVLLSLSTEPRPARLKVWLRGEYGVIWSLVVVQLDAQGHELARMSAPHTEREPRAYMPVELLAQTEQVLFVITNLANRLPDADEADIQERAFQLTVDQD